MKIIIKPKFATYSSEDTTNIESVTPFFICNDEDLSVKKSE